MRGSVMGGSTVSVCILDVDQLVLHEAQLIEITVYSYTQQKDNCLVDTTQVHCLYLPLSRLLFHYTLSLSCYQSTHHIKQKKWTSYSQWYVGTDYSYCFVLLRRPQILSQGFPSRMKNYYLQRFRDNFSSFQSLRWDHHWKLHVLPIISPPQ